MVEGSAKPTSMVGVVPDRHVLGAPEWPPYDSALTPGYVYTDVHTGTTRVPTTLLGMFYAQSRRVPVRTRSTDVLVKYPLLSRPEAGQAGRLLLENNCGRSRGMPSLADLYPFFWRVPESDVRCARHDASSTAAS
jgi:hypothetical protein